MGLFSKLKENFNHGGVKIAIEAPGSIHATDVSLPVTVSITNGPEPQTINRVTAEIIAESQNQSFDVNNNQQQPMMQRKTVARMDNNEVITLAPGETKQVSLTIAMNGAEAINAITGLDPNSTAGKAVDKLVGVLSADHSNAYTYSLQVSSDVAGIKLDPSKSQPLQILQIGEMGGSKTFNI